MKNVSGPPDLLVEIVSKGTVKRDRVTKRDLYERFAVPHYWILDPFTQELEEMTELVGDVVELARQPGQDAVARQDVALDELTRDAIERATRRARGLQFSSKLQPLTNETNSSLVTGAALEANKVCTMSECPANIAHSMPLSPFPFFSLGLAPSF